MVQETIFVAGTLIYGAPIVTLKYTWKKKEIQKNS